MGEEAAAQYLLRTAQEVAALAAASRPDLAVEAVRESVSIYLVLLRVGLLSVIVLACVGGWRRRSMLRYQPARPSC